MNKKLIYSALLMIFVVYVGAAMAQPMHGHFGKGEFPPMRGWQNIPDLTNEQKSEIEKRTIEHQKEMISVQSDLKLKQLNLRELIREQSDIKKIEKKVEEIGVIRTELQKKRIRRHLEIKSLLTDEQKEYMDSQRFIKKDNRPGRGMRGKHHPGGFRGPGPCFMND